MGTIFYFIFLLTFLVIYFPILFLIWVFSKPFDKKGIVVHEASRFLSHMIVRICPLWSVSISGREHVDRSKSYVIVANHQSMLDIPLMANMPLNFKWVSKREVYKIPFFGWVLWLRDDIGIERGGLSSTKKMLRSAKKFISNGISLVIYPEGTRSKTGKMGAFKEGAFIVAKTTGAPILPVVIDGTWIVGNWKGFGLKMPTKLRMTILEPIPAEDVKKMDLKSLSDLTKRRIETVYKELNNTGYENEQ